MTHQEIWTQLNSIHTEFVGDITPEQLEAAWAEGQANPCGCSVCQLMEAVTIAEVGEALNTELATLAIEALEPYARRFIEQYEQETPNWQKKWFLSWQQANLIVQAFDSEAVAVMT